MTVHGYLGNIGPAFPGNSLCNRISSNLNFQNIYFLITQASQYRYQRIPGNPAGNFFMTEIHRESHPISMCIPVAHLLTRYTANEIHPKYALKNIGCKLRVP